MRIRISLKTEKLPIIYRHRIMALIKEALNRTNPDYKNYLYPDKRTEHSKRVKPFTFSVTIPPNSVRKKEKFWIDKDFQVEDIVFYIPENMCLFLYVSSCDYQFIMNLYNGLLETKEFDFNDKSKLKLVRVSMLNECKITNGEVIFKTNSPISIEDKDSTPVLPMNTDPKLFNEHFNVIHNKILEDLRGENGKKGQGLYRDIEFTPIALKKKVIKHTLQGFREKTRKAYMTLTTFEGCFKLRGDPRDLQMLYQCGIGLRTGQGFGMVEVR